MLLHRFKVALEDIVPTFVQTLLLLIKEITIEGLEALRGTKFSPVHGHLETLVEDNVGMLLWAVDVSLHHSGYLVFLIRTHHLLIIHTYISPYPNQMTVPYPILSPNRLNKREFKYQNSNPFPLITHQLSPNNIISDELQEQLSQEPPFTNLLPPEPPELFPETLLLQPFHR